MKFNGFLCLLGCTFLLPNSVIPNANPGFFQKFANTHFVETGSFEGNTISEAIEAGFNEIHSIELSEKYYLYCKNRFSNQSNVHLWQGDSGTILEELIRPIQEPITFWLDAHYSTSKTARGPTNTPLIQELEIIKNHPIKTHTILIDDIRFLGDKAFDDIPLSKVVETILSINPNYIISYHDGFAKNDILVAQLKESIISVQDLPPPYDTAEILPFFEHGWYRNAAQIAPLIKDLNIKTIIEVGSWLGTSTRHMASCLPKEGIVYAVDHWKGSIEHQPDQQYWIPECERLYEYFLSNVIHAQLANKIIPVRMESLKAAAQLQIQADLIYIDASHDTESVYKDLVAWYPHVKKEGIFCGDDCGAPSVRKALLSFARDNRLQIQGNGSFWMIRKK